MRRSVLLALFPSLWLLLTASVAHADEGITKTWAIAEFGEPLYLDNFTHWPYANPDAPKGGHVTLADFGNFDNLNPYILKGEAARSVGLTTDSLMVGSADELSSNYGLIAETVEYPADKSWIIFNIRPEARYHDGTSITAEDFVYWYQQISQHGAPFLRSFFRDIEDVQALTPHRLKVTVKTRNNMKPLLIASSMPPLPRHHWKDRDFTATTLQPPLGSGAYRIKTVNPGRSITYERVKDYWAADLPVNRGLNNFDTIRYDYFRDRIVTFEAFKSGAIDYHRDYFSKNWATGYDFDAVKEGRIVKRAVPDENPQGLQAFVFNMRRPPLDDIRVRQAIAELYDFNSIRRLLLYGFYERSKSSFPNSDFGASGPPTPEEIAILEPYADQLRPEVMTQAFEPSQTDGSGRIRKNLRKAQALFREAGWEVRDGKLVNARTGRQMKLEFLLVSPSIERLTLPYVQNLKRAGIDASLRVVDTAQYQVRTNELDFDIVSVKWNFFAPPGPELRSYFGSATADEQGTANYAGIKNPVADALIEKIINAEDLDVLKTTTRALDRVLLWEFSSVPQYHNDEAWLAHWDMFGYPERKPRYSIGFPATWWVDTQKLAKLGRRGDG